MPHIPILLPRIIRPGTTYDQITQGIDNLLKTTDISNLSLSTKTNARNPELRVELILHILYKYGLRHAFFTCRYSTGYNCLKHILNSYREFKSIQISLEQVHKKSYGLSELLYKQKNLERLKIRITFCFSIRLLQELVHELSLSQQEFHLYLRPGEFFDFYHYNKKARKELGYCFKTMKINTLTLYSDELLIPEIISAIRSNNNIKRIKIIPPAWFRDFTLLGSILQNENINELKIDTQHIFRYRDIMQKCCEELNAERSKYNTRTRLIIGKELINP